ncbi:hypothetical protein FACS1894172_14180 [Spirochaetia bacterium]|nr:hypothetical protein FACS1894164_17810 [Spirochaetia bacterium]GHU34220.1 hypothetical protein FACS1894172_14180 [Spirochaetia bacterium]
MGNAMEEEKIFGYTMAEIEEMIDSVSENVDKNHPAVNDSTDNFIAVVKKGLKLMKEDKSFLANFKADKLCPHEIAI